MIFLFHEKKIQKALEYFDKAIKYAKPVSNYFTSLALLYKAKILFDSHEIDNAILNAKQASQLDSKFAEAHYHYAMFSATANDISTAMTALKQAIHLDQNYCLKAMVEPAFISCKSYVSDLIRQMTQQLYGQIEPEYRKAGDIIAILNKGVSLIHSKISIQTQVNTFDIAGQLIYSNRYFEMSNAKNLVHKLLSDLSQIKNDFIREFEKEQTKAISDLEKLQKDEADNDAANLRNIKSKRESIGYWFGISAFIIGLIPGFHGCTQTYHYFEQFGRNNYQTLNSSNIIGIIGSVIGALLKLVVNILGITVFPLLVWLIIAGICGGICYLIGYLISTAIISAPQRSGDSNDNERLLGRTLF
jgi:tetratricopeptide (TPR) repeat protein